MLKEENTYLKEIIKAVIVISFYIVASGNIVNIADSLKIFDIIPRVTFAIFCEVSILLIIIYMYKDDLVPMFKDFKKNIKTYLNKYFKYWLLILLLMLISNSIITQFTTTDTATNQEIIMDTFAIAPIYIIITTVLIAPLTEELIFRFCINKIVPKPRIIYIILSGVIFGSMHVVLNPVDSFIDLLFIIPYSIPGIVFAYLYDKTKNIFIPTSLHFIHNGVLMLLELIITLI